METSCFHSHLPSIWTRHRTGGEVVCCSSCRASVFFSLTCMVTAGLAHLVFYWMCHLRRFSKVKFFPVCSKSIICQNSPVFLSEKHSCIPLEATKNTHMPLFPALLLLSVQPSLYKYSTTGRTLSPVYPPRSRRTTL